VEFLASAFRLPTTAPFLDEALLRWKYDTPRPDWQGSRSYAWMEGSEIAAHACVCPVTYCVGGRRVAASYLIDWASSRRSPGAGVLLLRKLAALFPVLLAIGGSADTRQILPKLGYKAAGELAFFVRVVRPWRQFRTDPSRRGWKAPLRLTRNAIWSARAAPRAAAGWKATAILEFAREHEPLFETGAPYPAGRRTVDLMNYYLACPGASMTAFLMKRNGERMGWFVLSRVAGVMRIADLRIGSSDPEEWNAAYATATRTALADPHTCELIGAASTPIGGEALRASGFRLHHKDPIYVLDPGNLLAGGAPFEVSLIESDAAFLYSPEYPYIT